MQKSSKLRKPSSPLKPTHPKYKTSQQCAPIGCTRQEVGSLHSLETTSHSLQQTYLRLLIHTTQNFKWSRYTLTTLNIPQLITDVISNLDHITLNTNTSIRVPNTTLQQTSSPDITTVSNTLYNRTSWTTQHALSSDHLPIITTINIRNDYRLQQNRRTFTNYKKADWTQFTEDTESAFAQTTTPTNIHTANRIFTNIILMADKHNIPKGKMHSNCRLLPEDIVCKITQRNNIRRANTCDPAPKLLNEEITTDIQKHKQNIWKEHFDAHWDHRHNTHTLWKTIHGLSKRAPPHTLNTSITFNNKIATTPKHIANCFTKQFTNTVKHATHKTNRHINREMHNIQGYNITLTTSQVQEAIKKSKNNNSRPSWTRIPARTITVALDMSKAFDTINIPTLIRKLLQTNIPATIIKFIANYI